MITQTLENLSKHARLRQVQRQIPPIIIEWLQDYGTRFHDGKGAVIVQFDKESRRRLAKAVGEQVMNRLTEFLDAYAVLSLDGSVITVGWRYKRHQRR
jgi:hypothetical protein